MKGLKREKFFQYFTSTEWTIFALLIVAGLLLRWWGLMDRAFHHDESLHAIYGEYIYEDPQNKYYKYLPLLHGPLLYNILPYFYAILGISKWSARVPVALLGSLFIFVPFIFRKYFYPLSALFLTGFIALSPTFIYWSRFLRHDYLVIFSMLIVLAGVVFFKGGTRILWVVIGFVLQFCTKENAYITASLICGFCVYQLLLDRILIKAKDSFLDKICREIKNHWIYLLVSLVIGGVIYSYYFSAGFKYPQGILDGLYRESLLYWIKQHGVERIKGPFLFQFFTLSWYEGIFIVLFFAHIIHFYTKVSKTFRWIFAAVVLVTLGCYLGFKNENLTDYRLWRFFKLKMHLDLWGPFILIAQAFLVTTWHLIKRENNLAFWGYLFTASFFSYSFVGEKVPWLAIYPMGAGIIYFALYFNHLLSVRKLKARYWTVLCVFFLAMAINLRMSIITNFIRAGHNTELISQVHTAKAFEDLALSVRERIIAAPVGQGPKVITLKENTWPCAWYFHGLPEYSFNIPAGKGLKDFDFIFDEDRSPRKILAEDFDHLKVPFRWWWVPDYSKMGFVEFFSYAISHNPWNDPGTMYSTYYARKNL
jgi:uncharacterized protein (TIGR03663 family)